MKHTTSYHTSSRAAAAAASKHRHCVRAWALGLLSLLAALLITAASMVAYAYYSQKRIYDGYFGVNVELLFGRLQGDTLTAYQTQLKADLAEQGIEIAEDEDASWGTRLNPYIIENAKHIYNLSELQRLGYFDNNFIHNTEKPNFDAGGNYIRGTNPSMPYFVVCDSQTGKPVAIDGTDSPAIKPIGTSEHPFIGSIKGAFATGTCTPPAAGAMQSPVSAFYNLTVTCDPASIDAGLFGYVSYLGDESKATDNAFAGAISDISDLLLYDVKVEIRQPDWKDLAQALIEKHLFSYTGKTNANALPQENRHIGIVLGHIEYVRLKNISVYYSKDDIIAINLSDKTSNTNYMSTTGIVGFLYCMNPEIKNGMITVGSGIDSEDIQNGTSSDGTNGTGGGLESGGGPGYVWASDVYKTYRYIGTPAAFDANVVEDTTGTIYIKDAHTSNGTPLCQEETQIDMTSNSGYKGTGRYYFYDGVFTFALSQNQQDLIGPTWPNPAVGDSDQFKVGAANGTWNKTSTGGDANVVAFLRPINSDKDLYDAVVLGKKLVISYSLKNDPNGDIFLMTLSVKSTGDQEAATPDIAFYTPGEKLFNLSADAIELLKSGYVSGVWSPNGLGGGSAPANFEQNLLNDTYTIVNLGKSEFVSTLENDYTISGTMSEANTDVQYYFYNTEFVASVNNDKTEVPVLSKYKPNNTSDYGYFYFDVRSDTYYLCYKSLVNEANSKKDIASVGTGKIYSTDFYVTNQLTALEALVEQTRTEALNYSSQPWEMQTLYTCTKSEYTTLNGPFVDIENGKLYNYTGTSNGNTNSNNGNTVVSSSPLILNNNGLFTYSATDKKTCYIRNLNGKVEVTVDGQKQEIDLSEFTAEGDAEPKIYTHKNDKSISGYIIDEVPLYMFSSNNDFFMQLLSVTYQKTVSGWETVPAPQTYQLLWNGGETHDPVDFKLDKYNGPSYEPFSPEIDENNIKYASVRYAHGSWRIVYSNDDVMRYVSYNKTNTGRFTGVATLIGDNDSNSQIKIYVLDATKTEASGVVTFEPQNPYTGAALNADDYVLFASSSQTDAEGNKRAINDPNNAFTLRSIQSLQWKDKNGNTLSNATLSKKFEMSQQITTGTAWNWYGVVSENSGLVTAPVGSSGVQANIPQSCIAFRMNSADANGKTIRVIVAIPTSRLYPGEKQDGSELPASAYCYFNLWRFSAAGWENGVTQTFNPSNTLDCFYMPISRPCNPSATPETAAYVNISIDGQADAYRSYLNGNQVLIAYEFTVYEEGIYLLGASGFDAYATESDGTPKRLTVPTQIVYFSAEGVASEGRDGVNESRTGTVDFVYDNGTAILPVTASSDGADGEDYTTQFYPTYCLLYFDNGVKSGNAYLPIQEAEVKIRRSIVGGKATLTCSLTPPETIKITKYGTFADEIVTSSTAP